ncbi:YciI family protein [Klenkia sp. PcliD-1-E]|uniref:YciI family protein n=1 Tax=Klenkia sp. PcliD-1-E TaxID=2954492 RepID=UPI002096CC96|nr:YciI family protein [Klenkia sp. PcliD-1-E]MCO7220398.1 YciI family protein [Klenkia sp. PcliD-1-E]
MPQFLFMLYDDESRWADATERVLSQAWAGHDAFSAAVDAADGARILAGEGLTDAPTATTVRKDGFTATPVVTDGPFAETKEALGGFYLVECRDLEQALELAGILPVFSGGIEVRPVAHIAR